MESKVLEQKQRTKELDQRMGSVAEELNIFQRELRDQLHNIEAEIIELDTKVMKQKWNISELEKKMKIFIADLDDFQAELVNFVKWKEVSEIKARKFKQAKTDLAHLSVLGTSTVSPSKTHMQTKGDVAASNVVVPIKLKAHEELQSCYDDIITNMPDDYMKTVQLLERHLCSDHISKICECTSTIEANQLILSCLLENSTCRADILDLCEVLFSLRNAPQLVHIVKKLRTTVIERLQGAQKFQEANPVQSTLPIHSYTITSNVDVTTISRAESTKTTEVCSSNQQSGNYNSTGIAQKVANRSEDISLNDIRSCNETKASKPTMVYIQRLVIPRYAKHWRQIGTELLLDDQALDNIEANYAPYPRKVELCCREVITKWLTVDTAATWMKLLDAIDAVSTYPDAIGGLQYQPPPTLPMHYIKRPKLLQSVTEKILNTEIDNTVRITVLITGTAGFGKSTLALALCHQQLLKKHFLNGFLRIQLGEAPKNKFCMLCHIYRTLTGNTWTSPTLNAQGSIGEDDMVICLSEDLNLLCKRNPKLLVIIDDVWEVEDAIDYAEIFSGCKIILTTRNKNFTSSIPCKHEVCVDSMELSEAIQLLTSEVKELKIDNPDIISQLNELAINLHNWPLLLNLVRGQLDFYFKTTYSPLETIKEVTKKLLDNGLTAFDPTNNQNRKNAVNASIKASLDLLSGENLSRLKQMITSVLFGYAIPKEFLLQIWKVSKEKVNEYCNDFWSVGLIFYSSSFDRVNVEIHLVIIQYVFDNIRFDSLINSVVNSDLKSQIQIYMQYFMSKSFLELKESQLAFLIMETFDSIIIPVLLYKMPLMYQTIASALHNLLKHIFSHLDVEEIEKQTFMRVKKKCKIFISYLNNKNKDEAITFMTKTYDYYMQYLAKILNYFSYCTELPESIRNSLKTFVSILPSLSAQYAKSLVDMRTDLYDVTIVSNNFSEDKFVQILTTFLDQINEISIPMTNEVSTFLQTSSELP